MEKSLPLTGRQLVKLLAHSGDCRLVLTGNAAPYGLSMAASAHSRYGSNVLSTTLRYDAETGADEELERILSDLDGSEVIELVAHDSATPYSTSPESARTRIEHLASIAHRWIPETTDDGGDDDPETPPSGGSSPTTATAPHSGGGHDIERNYDGFARRWTLRCGCGEAYTGELPDGHDGEEPYEVLNEWTDEVDSYASAHDLVSAIRALRRRCMAGEEKHPDHRPAPPTSDDPPPRGGGSPSPTTAEDDETAAAWTPSLDLVSRHDYGGGLVLSTYHSTLPDGSTLEVSHSSTPEDDGVAPEWTGYHPTGAQVDLHDRDEVEEWIREVARPHELRYRIASESGRTILLTAAPHGLGSRHVVVHQDGARAWGWSVRNGEVRDELAAHLRTLIDLEETGALTGGVVSIGGVREHDYTTIAEFLRRLGDYARRLMGDIRDDDPTDPPPSSVSPVDPPEERAHDAEVLAEWGSTDDAYTTTEDIDTNAILAECSTYRAMREVVSTPQRIW